VEAQTQLLRRLGAAQQAWLLLLLLRRRRNQPAQESRP
jgi:hypothetical protein